MNRIVDVAKCLCWCLLAVLLGSAALLVVNAIAIEKQIVHAVAAVDSAVTDAKDAVRDTHFRIGNAIDELTPHLAIAIDRASHLEGHANAFVDEATITTKQERTYWNDSNAKLTALLDDSDTTLKQFATAIDHTDKSINGDMLPAVTLAVTHTANVADQSSQSISEITAELKPILESSATLLADPHIAASLENIDHSTAALSKTADHVEVTAGYYEKKLTTPVSAAKSFALFALKSAGAIGSFFQGVLK